MKFEFLIETIIYCCKKVENMFKAFVAEIFQDIRGLVLLSHHSLKPFILFINSKINYWEEYFGKKFLYFNEKTFNESTIIKQNKSLIYNEVINMLNRRQKGKFYAPLLSFWPLFLTVSVALFLTFVTMFFHSSKLFNYLNFLTIVSFIAIVVSVSFWFSIFYLEKKKGNHVAEIRRNIELGFYLFLFTEALCFIALFWVFLHSFLAAGIHIGIYNPGEGIANIYINEFVKINENWNIYYFKSVGTPSYFRVSSIYTLADPELFKTKDIKLHVNFYDRGQLINPYKLPLLNTFILLTSAACLNISHVSIRTSRYLKSFFWLFVTIFLGFFFVFVQYKEYKDCTFQYNDGIYAACFFSLTGLHGIHVMIGISALIVCAINLLFQNYSPSFHQSYMYSIFYWHFVDVIWILVYFIMYLWPAYYFFIDEIFTNYKTFFTTNFSKNYFNKVLSYNAFQEYKFNNQIFYSNFCKSFFKNESMLAIDNFKTGDSFFAHNENNLYSARWKVIKNALNAGLNVSIKVDCNYGDIISDYVDQIWKVRHQQPTFWAIKAILFNSTLQTPYKVLTTNPLKLNSIHDFGKVMRSMKSYEYCYQSIFLITLAGENLGGISKKLLKGVFSNSYDLDFLYFKPITKNYDLFEIESFYIELVEKKNSINYNGVKKDPLFFCFVMTEMHKELLISVERAYIIDFLGKYNRFMIYLMLHNVGLKPLSYLWCYFFFPYINANDASIRYRI